MSEFIMVACDLHDKRMLLKIARGREAAATMSVVNTRSGRARLIDQLQKQSAAAGAKVVFAYEASGQGFGLYDELTDAGITCYVLAPTKIARSTQHKRRKTDEQDAEQILQLLRGHVLAGNPLPKVWIPDLQTRDDRETVRARMDVAEKLAAVKTQIKCLLKRNRLIRPDETGKTWTRLYKGWLRSMVRDKAIGVGARETLASLLRQLQFLENEIRCLDAVLERLASSPRYEAAMRELVKLQGVQLLSALVFLTEIGDLRRFTNRRQLGAYLGLVPRSFESGSANDRKGHITCQGPGRVRRILCQAAWARIRTEGPDHAAYHRIAERNPKHKKVAVVAAMRRLAVRMWHRALEGPPETKPRGRSRRTDAPAPAVGRACAGATVRLA